MDRQTADQVVYIQPAAKDVISLSLAVPTMGKKRLGPHIMRVTSTSDVYCCGLDALLKW